MNLEVADAIRQDFGKYLELTHGRLLALFLAKIPESFLPYPKDTIEEALNAVAEHFHNQANVEAVDAMQTATASLTYYTKDEEAVKQFLSLWGNKEMQKEILKIALPNLKKAQQAQLQYIIDKYG